MNNNKDKRLEAVALSYDEKVDQEPKVVAKGKGYVAEKMIHIAKEKNIPIQEDPNLIELLSKLNINERIPEELYMAVAEVFAFVYKTNQEFEERKINRKNIKNN